MLPSAKCTRPLFQGRTGCGGRPSGWHDIVTCQHLVAIITIIATYYCKQLRSIPKPNPKQQTGSIIQNSIRPLPAFPMTHTGYYSAVIEMDSRLDAGECQRPPTWLGARTASIDTTSDYGRSGQHVCAGNRGWPAPSFNDEQHSAIILLIVHCRYYDRKDVRLGPVACLPHLSHRYSDHPRYGGTQLPRLIGPTLPPVHNTAIIIKPNAVYGGEMSIPCLRPSKNVNYRINQSCHSAGA